jgi:adenylate cyclase
VTRARRLRRRRLIVLAAIAVAAAALGIAGYAARVTNSLELSSIDTRFQIRGTQPPPNDIVLVKVDTPTLSFFARKNHPRVLDVGKRRLRWPFPRRLHAHLIDLLRRDGASTIAVDLEFSAPTDRRDDNDLIRAIGRDHGHVVLAATEVNGRGQSNVLGGEHVLHGIGARAGNTTVRPDPGGILRRFPFSYQKLDSFAVATVEANTGHPVSAAPIGGPTKSAYVDYRGPPRTIRSVSYVSAVRGHVPPRVFRNKIVVIGVTQPTIGDVHAVPTSDRLMSGPEYQANTIWTVEHGFPLGSSSGVVAILLILGFAAAPPLLNLRLGAFLALGAAVVLGALYAVAVQLAFDGGTILPLTYPLVALAIAAVGSLAATTVMTAFERQWVRDTFSRFVPAAVVDEVLERTDEDNRLGGVRRQTTVLFSDLRGFTSFSESLEPDQVIECLNRYLSVMCDAIMGHGGTLVAYMGDGIMAVFGAPLEQDDHADRALAASREMLSDRLPHFNAWLREQGYSTGFQMGIGLNSGLVMSGQVGSDQRMEYTAVGDTTNTAARLEGMTKDTPHSIFIAGSTKESLTRDPGDLAFVDEFPVRGREATIAVWTIPEGAVVAEPQAQDVTPDPQRTSSTAR